jgi:hypothetical protein
MTEEEFNNRLKMYILIRKDILTDVQCGVQAAHALQEYNINHPDCEKLKSWAHDHKTLIFLEANAKQFDAYTELPLKHASFYESDLDNMETAVAFEPVTHLQGVEIFSKLKLI